MKIKLLLAGLLILLLNTGSSCINESILVAVNLPISATWKINPSNSVTHFKDSTKITLADQIDASYTDNLEHARYYDIRVSVAGSYTGNITNGVARINGDTLLTFRGSWAQFKTPRSLLGSDSLITPKPKGVATLVSVLNSFVTNPATKVTLSGEGDLSTPPSATDMTLTFEIFAQVDAEVGSGSSN